MLTKYQNFTFKISFESFNQKLIVLKERKKNLNPLTLYLYFFRCSKTKKRRSTYNKEKKKYGKDARNSANIVESSDDNWNFGRMLKSEGDTPEDGISFED